MIYTIGFADPKTALCYIESLNTKKEATDLKSVTEW